MRAAVYYGPGEVKIERVPDPGPPGPLEVVLKIQMGALCGTDATLWKAGRNTPLAQPHPESHHQGPFILGHEVTGIVVEKGSEVTDLAVGQRVVPGSGVWCGTCPQCRVGRFNVCQHYHLLGRDTHGGLAEYATYPASMCFLVPKACSIEAAAMAQPLAVALHALRRADISAGEWVAIFGAGSIGSLLIAALSAQAPGAQIIALDLVESRLATAHHLGAACLVNVTRQDPTQAILELTGGHGVEVAIDATGDPETIAQALASVGRGGRLLQVGIPSRPVPLPLDQAVLCERDIITTNGLVTPIDLPHALKLLAESDLAQRIGPCTISLDDLVERGLRPLAEHRAPAKILVQVASDL